MATKRLHNLAIPGSALTSGDETRQQNLVQQGVLNRDTGVTQSVSSQPGTIRLQGSVRGINAKAMAEELREFGNAVTMGPFAYFDEDTRTLDDGYYNCDSVSIAPADPRQDNLYSFTLTLSKHGTQNSHWRRIAQTIQTVDNIGTAGTITRICIPDTATKVQWYNPTSTATAPASPSGTTVTTEFATLTEYDLSDAPSNEHDLIFELPYADEVDGAVRVWDSLGSGTRTDAEGELAWQHVYDTAHPFEGDVILSNGWMRVTVDESAGTLTHETYSGGWSTTTLSPGGWEIEDIDITRIGPQTTEFQLRTTDGTTTYHLNGAMVPGEEEVLLYAADSESGSPPSGLASWLNPISLDTDDFMREYRDTVARSEVRA